MSESLLPIIRKCLLLGLIFQVSCTGGKRPDGQKPETTGPKPDIVYAKRFIIEQKEGYSQLTIINPWQGASSILQRWYLVPRGERVTSDLDSSMIIRVPVKNIICMSTTHLAAISALGEAGTITGFSGTRFIYDSILYARAERGEIKEIGYEDNLNKELIVNLQPDLIMVYGIGGESTAYIGKLRDLGVKVMFNADYLETDPLGKAEWIRMVGALYRKDMLADSIFRSVRKRYHDVADSVSRLTQKKPFVLLGLPYRDTWYVSPGNSYVSKLIEDGGGDYLWKGTESETSMPKSIESVFVSAIRADYWLNTGTARSEADIVAIDTRLADLPCVRSGNLYNNDRRINRAGGNDYWESGSINPDIILKDIASILHPGLFAVHKLFYYRKLH
jgi:iron complex transport system substrate-binding protein